MTDAARKPSAIARKKAARLMAVQAVYQMAVNHKEAPFVVDEYLFLRTNMDVDGETMVEPDGVLFTSIVKGVETRHADLRDIVDANRPRREGQSEAEEPLLMSVLLCGAYELLAHNDVDAPIVISGYVDVAKAFFSGKEPSLINAVLDSVCKVTRG